MPKPTTIASSSSSSSPSSSVRVDNDKSRVLLTGVHLYPPAKTPDSKGNASEKVRKIKTLIISLKVLCFSLKYDYVLYWVEMFYFTPPLRGHNQQHSAKPTEVGNSWDDCGTIYGQQLQRAAWCFICLESRTKISECIFYPELLVDHRMLCLLFLNHI